MRLKWLLFCLLWIVSACSVQVHFNGVDLAKTPAPDFTLIDQHSTPISLGALRGNVVALTFLYTHCADVCPLIVSKLERVNAALGDAAKQVRFVGISVDPEHDTPVAIQAFLQRFAMDKSMLYLGGPRVQLEPVWKSYYIAAVIDDAPSTQVEHASRVVLIDRAGYERVHFDPDFAPDDLTHDLRILLDE